ncbi:MAG: MFS transporter [Verrucomicrobiales bacterium]|nr:MFS transporter [Verrucomicrobiales bacterium]MCP5557859.1 MFS transporter [Verrucomicrobiaceae bacterium]
MMNPGGAETAAVSLDELPVLPGPNRRSVIWVLLVQALNAFNDNFVKMLLVSLALTVAKGTQLGDNMMETLMLVFSIPFIVLAPTAGWLSDRFSKRQVIVWMQLAQMGCFGLVGAAVLLRDPHWSLWLGLVGFFFLAAQSTFFSPAKLGIIKEIVGTKRLGSVSGLLQMTMLSCVLAGIWAGGTCYQYLLEKGHSPWASMLWPIGVISVVGLLQLAVSTFIIQTPAHPDITFRKEVAWQHLGQLKLLFAKRPIRLAGLGISFFWLVSNAVGMIVVTLAAEMDRGPAEVSKLAALLGLGVIIGSLLAGVICRRRLELGLIPVAGFGMAAGLVAAGLVPLGGMQMYAALVGTGIAGGCFMVPLYAFVQDRSAPDERGRIMAAINLLDCVATILVGVIVVVLKKFGLSGGQQLMFFATAMALGTLYTMRLLPQDLIRFVGLAIVRSIYKVRVHHAERIPKTGPVLLLPNHVSYVDALILTAACGRPVRFVIWDEFYRSIWLNGFLRIFGTVPISPKRAKDAIRTVAAALKEGEVVCLFPEGQLTRHGMINELRKGYELMARQADAPVMPVYTDGLWGSFFSFEGGRFFGKWPKRLRYPVAVFFGEPLGAKQASTTLVRKVLSDLSAEAFVQRKTLLAEAENSHRQCRANAQRLLDILWIRRADRLWCALPTTSRLHQTLKAFCGLHGNAMLTECPSDAVKNVQAWVDAAQLRSLDAAPSLSAVYCVDPALDEPTRAAAAQRLGVPVLRGWADEATGALLALEVPEPPMPAGASDHQPGSLAGSVGRLLPGLGFEIRAGGLAIHGIAPGDATEILLRGMSLDDQGFVVFAPAAVAEE